MKRILHWCRIVDEFTGKGDQELYRITGVCVGSI